MQLATRFDGKTVLFIGATQGIGEAAATAFAAAGANVVIAGLGHAAGAAIEACLNDARPGSALFVETNVTVEADMAHLMQQAVERFGRVHVACNNAGIEGPFCAIHEIDEADVDQLLDVNIKGIWRGMRHQIRHMLLHGGGCIVNTASSAGVVAIPQVGLYSATKHAIIGLSRAAALEQARAGIRINVVAPGPVRTGLLSRMVQDHVPLETIADVVPMGRISTPAEIAAAILWLASDAASYVTGHVLLADGGLTVA